ncbi:hypothetical protein DAEQUDRAFT_168225 [Daedalea quercina L-15889]|uniref:Uncharacterized protein n=1 Tax=Daedalea quercina L-15889 TaxID=1314783 RepID=A0A165RJK2_9APHY|nr:hypothetical protein DAEQUDRAFT_168225 [Daedalea quercina L-15889]
MSMSTTCLSAAPAMKIQDATSPQAGSECRSMRCLTSNKRASVSASPNVLDGQLLSQSPMTYAPSTSRSITSLASQTTITPRPSSVGRNRKRTLNASTFAYQSPACSGKRMREGLIRRESNKHAVCSVLQAYRVYRSCQLSKGKARINSVSSQCKSMKRTRMGAVTRR